MCPLIFSLLIWWGTSVWWIFINVGWLKGWIHQYSWVMVETQLILENIKPFADKRDNSLTCPDQLLQWETRLSLLIWFDVLFWIRQFNFVADSIWRRRRIVCLRFNRPPAWTLCETSNRTLCTWISSSCSFERALANSRHQQLFCAKQ